MSAPKKIEPSKLAPFFEAIVNADSNNRFCADCHSKNPRWASTNLGIFLCIKCAGIHRHIGTHITKVKSTTLDCWEERQIMVMKRVGNTLAATVWEATLPSSYPRPNEQSEGMALESFIRSKYEHRKWFNKNAFEAVYNGKGPAPKPKSAAAPAPAPAPAPPKAAPAQTTNFFDFGEPVQSANTRKPAPAPAQQQSTNFFDFGTPATAAPAPAAVPAPAQKPQQQSSANLLSFDEPPRPQQGAGASNASIMSLFGAQPQYQQAQMPQQYYGQPQVQQPQQGVNLYAQGSGTSGANYSVDLSAYGIYRNTPQQQQQQVPQQQQQYYMQQQQQQQYYMQQQQQMYGYNPAYNRNGF